MYKNGACPNDKREKQVVQIAVTICTCLHSHAHFHLHAFDAFICFIYIFTLICTVLPQLATHIQPTPTFTTTS